MSDIYSILTDLGYQLTQDKDGWRTNALFRGGSNPTAIKIFANNGNWCDFVENKKGTLEDLIKLTLNLDDIQLKEYIAGNHINIEKVEYKEKLKISEIFDESVLKDLIPDYTYWINRGISKNTCELFQGGLCLDSQSFLGKLKRRQILVIRNSQNKIVGFTGRAIDKDNKIKYKHLGVTKNWVWPCYLNNKLIKETREVFLVESPVCVMKCFDCGIKNVIALFGTECHFSVVNYLLKINPKMIFISTNNELDSQNGGVGNKAALSIYGRLKKYFNNNQIKIHLPPCKDFAEKECTNDKIKDWYERRYL